MKSNSILMLVFLIIFALGFQTASAQITITIPKLPKIKKPKIEQPQPQTESSSPVADDKENRSNDNQTQDNRTIRNENADEQKPDECETNSIARLVADEVNKMTEDVNGYTPERGWLYSGSPTYKYLLIAVSPAAKQDWQKRFSSISNCPKIAAAFEKLSAAAAKKLPLFLLDKSAYAVHNLAEEKLMKSKISDFANHKIFYTGITEPSWLIAKNDYGLPTARYKHGMIWARYTPDDHPYCRVYYVNIVQDYAGGGTYGASYGNFISDYIVGCPSGK